MPGVSRKAICPRASFRMPTMRLRVVCGLAETMETFCPRMRLRSVDFPALGRPTRATTPLLLSLSRAERGISGGTATPFALDFCRRCATVDPSSDAPHPAFGHLLPASGAKDLTRDPSPREAGRGCREAAGEGLCSRPPPAARPSRSLFFGFLPFRIPRDLHPIDAPAIGAIDFEAIAVLGHHRSRFRNAAESGEDHARNGLVVFAGKMGVEHLLQGLDPKRTADQILVVAEGDDGRFHALMLVADVSNNILHDVLDRDDACRPTILIDHDGHL